MRRGSWKLLMEQFEGVLETTACYRVKYGPNNWLIIFMFRFFECYNKTYTFPNTNLARGMVPWIVAIFPRWYVAQIFFSELYLRSYLHCSSRTSAHFWFCSIIKSNRKCGKEFDHPLVIYSTWTTKKNSLGSNLLIYDNRKPSGASPFNVLKSVENVFFII